MAPSATSCVTGPFVRTEGGGRSAYSKLDAEQCLDGPAFCRPPSISASSERADSAPISCSASRAKLLDPRSHTRQPRWCILWH
jgi:hypothetical protein